MANRSTHAIRWGIALTVLWAILVLLSFTPPQASASEHSAEVVVLRDSGAGRGPERTVEDLGACRA